MTKEYTVIDALDLTETYDQMVEDLAAYRDRVDDLERAVDIYQETVSRHQQGAMSDNELAQSVSSLADVMEDVDDYQIDARSGVEELHIMLNLVEEDHEYATILSEAQLAKERLDEMTDDELPYGIDGLETLTAVYNETAEQQDELENTAHETDEYLEETLGTTLIDVMYEEDPLLDARVQQAKEAVRAERVLETPNDLDSPYVAGHPAADLDEARERVREGPAAGFYHDNGEHAGWTADELEAADERISEARERIREKDDVRGFQ